VGRHCIVNNLVGWENNMPNKYKVMDTYLELVNIAKSLCGKKDINSSITVAKVAAGLLTESGEIFTGISIEAPCGIGFCAEHAAIAEMLKHGQTKIKYIVAVNASGIVIPCGRCREFIRQVDASNYSNTLIAVKDGENRFLCDLLPFPFLSSKE